MGTHPIFESDFDCLTDYDGQISKALDARIVETTVEQSSNKKLKRTKEKELIYLKKPIRIEHGTFYLIKSTDIHPSRFRNDFLKVLREYIIYYLCSSTHIDNDNGLN